jgi:hypothetical protein
MDSKPKTATQDSNKAELPSQQYGGFLPGNMFEKPVQASFSFQRKQRSYFENRPCLTGASTKIGKFQILTIWGVLPASPPTMTPKKRTSACCEPPRSGFSAARAMVTRSSYAALRVLALTSLVAMMISLTWRQENMINGLMITSEKFQVRLEICYAT